MRELRLVQAIEEHGSLARAARVLGTSQPTLTRSLAALEARLRGRLFERGSRGVIATDLGQAVLADAAEILARLERLNRHLLEVRGGQVRDLTIVAGAYAAESVGLIAAAREAAPAAGAMHPAFPALVLESPRASLALLRHCDAVAGVTVAVAPDALRLGEVVALPWRAPWVSVHPGVVRLRGRPLGEAEQGFLDLLRDADAETERDAMAWCAAAVLSPDCGGAEPYPPTKPDAAMARSSGVASKPKSA